MSMSNFSGKPSYTLQKYPQTQVKDPGPKQIAVLKQTCSLEKLDRHPSPQKLPNLKPINSSMSQYGPQVVLSQPVANKPTTSDDHRIGEGLINIQPQNGRPGPN